MTIELKHITPLQLEQFLNQAASASFAGDLLEVDDPLWGGFWSGDVIAPGYRLPAVELALLRAIRLDGTWPAGSSGDSFQAGLRQVVAYPQNGVWTLAVAGQPCLICTAPGEVATGRPAGLAAVAWYCLTTRQLHAGYLAAPQSLIFSGAVLLRPPTWARDLEAGRKEAPGWVKKAAARQESLPDNLAARLDAAILRVRAGLG